MQIVISISEEDYKKLIKYGEPLTCGNQFDDTIMKAVANGVILPEGHGRLGDLDALAHEMVEENLKYDATTVADWCLSVCQKAPTILEADKESENENLCITY